MVLGSLSTITVSIVASAPIGAPSELRITGMLGSGASKESLAELARLEANLTDIDDSVFIRLSGPGLICFYMSLFCLYTRSLLPIY
jgi:hypothetical protein